MENPAPARDSRANLERETGFEPATSTLARSHSTTELLPLVFSFYCTCAFRDNSLHPRRHPLFLTGLFCIGHRTAVREETLDKLGLSVPCLVAIVNVVHRHIYMRLGKHALQNDRVGSVLDQECGKPVPQVVKPEPRAIFRDHSSSHRRRHDVVPHDHTGQPWLFSMQLERREHEVRVLAVWSLLAPRL